MCVVSGPSPACCCSRSAIEVVIALCCSPRFWIYRLEASGGETISGDDIIRLAQLPAESNYYRTSLRELEERIAREPRVQQATVRRQSVGVLAIDVAERVCACRLGHMLPLTYLDADGHLFERPIPPAFPVPVLEGVAVPATAKQGAVLTGDATVGVLRCLAALRDKSPDDPDLSVTRLVVNRQGKLILVLAQGTRIYLGDPDDLVRKIWVVRKTVVEAHKQGYPLDNLQYIDAQIIERVTELG